MILILRSNMIVTKKPQNVHFHDFCIFHVKKNTQEITFYVAMQIDRIGC